MGRILKKHLPPVAILSFCAAVFFLPALGDLDGTFVGVFLEKGDAEGTLWWNWAVREAVLAGRAPVSTGSIYFPFGCELAPFYGSVLNSLLYLPLNLALPLPASNTLYCLLLLIADALAGYFLFFTQTKKRGAALALAVLWAFAPMKFMEYRDGHLPQIPFCFIPPAVWALRRIGDRPGLRAGLAAGLILALDACGYYQHAFGALFLFVFFLVGKTAAAFPRKEAGRVFMGYLACGIVVAAGALFFYAPLLRAALSFAPEAGFVYPDRLPAELWQLRKLPGGNFFERTSLIRLGAGAGTEAQIMLIFAGMTLAAALASFVLRPRETWGYFLLGLFFLTLLLGPFIRVTVLDSDLSVGAGAHLAWRSPLYAFFYAYLPGFSRLYWPDTFWPYAHVAACLTLASAAGVWLRRESRQSRTLSLGLLAVLACGTLILSGLQVRSRPFHSRYNRSPVIDALKNAPGRAFLPLPSGTFDDYHLPAVVRSGKALMGGRGRDLGYLVPAEWAALAWENLTLRSLENWTPLNRRRRIDTTGVEALAKIGVDRALLDKAALKKLFENPLLRVDKARVYEDMLREAREAFGPALAEDRRFVLFDLLAGR